MLYDDRCGRLPDVHSGATDALLSFVPGTFIGACATFAADGDWRLVIPSLALDRWSLATPNKIVACGWRPVRISAQIVRQRQRLIGGTTKNGTLRVLFSISRHRTKR